MKKIIGVMCAVIFICAGLCGCGSTDSTGANDNKANKEIESVMQAGPTTMDEWKIVMLDYESYFKEENFISQSNTSDACYTTMTDVTEEEFKTYVDAVAKIYSNDMMTNFGTDSDGHPRDSFYGETPDGKYTLSAQFRYRDSQESLVCVLSCYMETEDDEESEE